MLRFSYKIKEFWKLQIVFKYKKKRAYDLVCSLSLELYCLKYNVRKLLFLALKKIYYMSLKVLLKPLK